MRVRKIILAWSACLVSIACVAEARAELVAHWKFENDAPYEDAVSGLNLNPEGKTVGGKAKFRIMARKPKQAAESKGSLVSPSAKSNDLRLRVNAPTRGGNPFRLTGNTWTLSGWFLHSGEDGDSFGHVIAGTHGHSRIEGRGFGGWSLRVIKDEDDRKLSALFSTGGGEPVSFEVKSESKIETGGENWTHFVLVWTHDAGEAGKGEARLFVNAKPAGTAAAPENFDTASADRNSFRGIWIAGRSTSKEQAGSQNWPGWLDDMKFHSEAIVEEARLAAEFGAPEPKPEPKVAAVTPKPKPATEEKPKAPAPPPPPPPKPEPPKEKILDVRTWTDIRKKTMEAAMVIVENPESGRVLLQTSDGIRFSLPLERLSEADRDYAASAR